LCGFAQWALAEGEDPAPVAEPPMSYAQMASLMRMDDTERVGKVRLDELEWRDTRDGAAAVWEGYGAYGGDYDKLFVRSEGERIGNDLRDARVELLWDRIITRWWDVQLGAREDFGGGPARTWAALGAIGTAVYGFDTEITLYAGD